MMKRVNLPKDFGSQAKALRSGISVGYCRICGAYGELTADHIPPKACGNSGNIFINGRKFQGGNKIQSICPTCNNVLLGGNYDVEYAKIYTSFNNYLHSGLTVPDNKLKLACSVDKIFKCAIGHFLASWVLDEKQEVQEILSKSINECPITSDFRKYFFDDDTLEGYEIYYWFYPFNTLRIDHAFGRMAIDETITSHQSYIGSTIKMKPLAFYIISKDNHSIPFSSLYPMITPLNIKGDEIILNLSTYALENWPETIPDARTILLTNLSQRIEVGLSTFNK